MTVVPVAIESLDELIDYFRSRGIGPADIPLPTIDESRSGKVGTADKGSIEPGFSAEQPSFGMKASGFVLIANLYFGLIFLNQSLERCCVGCTAVGRSE